jgi:7-carboxy-7-deazaguanine synthase
MNATPNLRINEIFFSLQGETRTVGLPTVFVRLTGCPLRCVYCDTEYAFHKGDLMPLEAIVNQVEGFGAHYVTVSGGEPLAQPNCLPLLSQLCDKGYEVSLETSGALDIASVDSRVVTVMDLKTPSSGESSKNLESNIGHLKPHDQVKFVIGDRKDYEWSKAKCDQFDLKSRVSEVLFSPVFEALSYRDLAQWILDDRLNVRMQLQLHKHIWGDKPGH